MNSFRAWWYGMLLVRLQQIEGFFNRWAASAERRLFETWRAQDNGGEKHG